MGSKGSNTTTTQQQQTYTPTGQAAIQSALNQGQAAAQLPFNIPQAPVAGFSQDQQNAFNTVNQSQGIAQPYINQAQQDFTPQGTQSFFNPYASAVTAQMNNIFGQQQAATTGSLTQAAGGVGADRIAVGQSELANQQGLAAGQTYANLYGQAAQQAQSAGYGQAALGSQAQNSALTGAQAQLGTGGLQQQLSQAQLNSPYQLQLAQAAFPYQQAQFNAGITGALAPGLGGTTEGTGSTTAPAPSLLSQILGLGTAGVGIAGQAGAFGSGSAGGTPGSPISGLTYGPTSYGGASGPTPLAGSGVWGSARGGSVGSPYASGGAANDTGGAPTSVYNLPAGFNDAPINVDSQSIIPTGGQLPQAKAQMPSLNLNPPAASQSGSGNAGQAIASAAKIAMMFAKDGGRIDPKKHDGVANPHAFAVGGDTDVINPDGPYRMPDQAAVDAWRDGTPLPGIITGENNPEPTKALAFAPSKKSSVVADGGYNSIDAQADAGSPYAMQPSKVAQAPSATSDLAAAPAAADSDNWGQSFIKSPWAAVTAAGLGIAGGTSPFAAVNIGQGGMQGIKALEEQRTASQKDETVKQAAKRLEQEAKFHEDAYTRRTLSQQDVNERSDRPYEELTKAEKLSHDLAVQKQNLEEMKPVVVGHDLYQQPILAKRNRETGEYEIIKPPGQVGIPGGPSSNVAPAPGAAPVTTPASGAPPRMEGLNPTQQAVIKAKEDDTGLPANAQFISEPPVAPASPGVFDQMAQQGASKGDIATVQAIGEGRQPFLPVGRSNPKNQFLMDKVHEAYPDVDATTFNRRQRTANFFAVGTQGGGGQNIAAMNTFAVHASNLLDLSNKLDRGQFTDVNDAKNWLAEHGYATKGVQDMLGAYEVARTAVAGEAAKVFAGSNTALADREHWLKIFNANSPASTMRAKMTEAVHEVEGRLSSLTQQYNEGMRTNHQPQELIGKKTRDAFEALKGNQPGGGAKADPATRFNQLTQGGMSSADAYKKMHEEGY